MDSGIYEISMFYVFVCFNQSPSFRNDDFSLFTCELDQEAKLLRNDH